MIFNLIGNFLRKKNCTRQTSFIKEYSTKPAFSLHKVSQPYEKCFFIVLVPSEVEKNKKKRGNDVWKSFSIFWLIITVAFLADDHNLKN